MLSKLINGYQRWAWIPWVIGVGLMVAGLITLRQPMLNSSSSYEFEEQVYLATIGIGILIILVILSGVAHFFTRMHFVWDLVWMSAALLMLCGIISWSGNTYKQDSRSRQYTEVGGQHNAFLYQRAAWFVFGGAACILLTSSILMLEPPTDPEHSPHAV
ncbi:hypothetical protein ACP8Y2_07020 [Herpetosiphon llansteffanensis]